MSTPEGAASASEPVESGVHFGAWFRAEGAALAGRGVLEGEASGVEGEARDPRAIRGQLGRALDSVEVIAEDLESVVEEVHADLVASSGVDLALDE